MRSEYQARWNKYLEAFDRFKAVIETLEAQGLTSEAIDKNPEYKKADEAKEAAYKYFDELRD